MHKLIQAVLNSDEKTVLRKLIDALSSSGKRYFLRNEILQVFADCHCDQQQVGNSYHGSSLSQLIHYTHEIILDNESIWLLITVAIGKYLQDLISQEISLTGTA